MLRWHAPCAALCRRLVGHPAGTRGYVGTKQHRRRKDWESTTYPRAATEEPKSLPRRGRRGGWMRDPARGVAKLDGTNTGQQEWWQEHSEGVDRAFVEKVRDARDGGAPLQEVMDGHLQELDALRVRMPSAEDIRKPHVARLARTAKPNLVHEAAGGGPPLSARPEDLEPPFVGESLEVRRERRGRFLGRRQQRYEDASALDGAAMPGALPEEDGGEAEASRGRKSTPRAAWAAGRDDAGAGDDVGVTAPARGGRRSQQDQAPEWHEGEPGWTGEEAAGPSRGRKGLRRPQQVPPPGFQGEEDSDAAGFPPTEPAEPLRQASLSDIWSSCGASWVEFNRCVVPSAFPALQEGGLLEGATMDVYQHTREAASLFDVSFKVGLRLTGADREFVADQFLTCSLRSMRVGDVQYACLLDSKGLILDDAFVYLAPNTVEILTSGSSARQVADYLGQYVGHVRRSGAEVSLGASLRTTTLALQGPRAQEALERALAKLAAEECPLRLHVPGAEGDRVALEPSVLAEMPYMSFLDLRRGPVASPLPAGQDEAAAILRVGTTGEDGFEVVAEGGDEADSIVRRLALALLEEAPLVRPAGVFCLDVLRMEAGLPRVGADIPPGKVTPIRASLVWMLDQAKMRSHLMFGWERLFFQLAKGPQFRRVALLLDGPAHAGCRLLSNPHRQPIGEITSSAWSPALQSRVAMAYIKPEYAKENKQILVTVPYNLPTHKMKGKAIKHWIRQGPLRSAYRRLVAAAVVPLPLVPHRYPEPQRQRRAAARLRPFAPEREGAPGPSEGPARQRRQPLGQAGTDGGLAWETARQGPSPAPERRSSKTGKRTTRPNKHNDGTNKHIKPTDKQTTTL